MIIQSIVVEYGGGAEGGGVKTHRAVWRASPRHARTALAKGELDLTNIEL